MVDKQVSFRRITEEEAKGRNISAEETWLSSKGHLYTTLKGHQCCVCGATAYYGVSKKWFCLQDYLKETQGERDVRQRLDPSGGRMLGATESGEQNRAIRVDGTKQDESDRGDGRCPPDDNEGVRQPEHTSDDRGCREDVASKAEEARRRARKRGGASC